jgi:hypothetical protein
MSPLQKTSLVSGLSLEPPCDISLILRRYFVNEQDEVRSIKDPDCYFKFFINKNSRVNERQRFQLQRIVTPSCDGK